MFVNVILGHLFNVFYVVGFAIKDVYWLRMCLVTGSVIEIVYSYRIADKPLWVNIFWASVAGSINVIQILWIRRDRRLSALTEEEQVLRQTVFKNLELKDYRRLLEAGAWKNYEAGETLANEGEHLDRLFLIYHGAASVDAGGKRVAILTDRKFIGEMSLLTGNPASATVTTIQPTNCLTWTKNSLRRMLDNYPSLRSSMQTVISIDLVSKLVKTSD
jgi:hypothetical protein